MLPFVGLVIHDYPSGVCVLLARYTVDLQPCLLGKAMCYDLGFHRLAQESLFMILPSTIYCTS